MKVGEYPPFNHILTIYHIGNHIYIIREIVCKLKDIRYKREAIKENEGIGLKGIVRKKLAASIKNGAPVG